MSAPKTEYIPGVCNIGPAEIRRRWQAFYFGLILTAGMWLVFFLTNVHHAVRLSLFFTAALGAAGFLQAVNHFCARFGLAGVFNFGAAVGKTDTVEQAEFRRLDRRKAQLIFLGSVGVGLVFAALGYFI